MNDDKLHPLPARDYEKGAGIIYTYPHLNGKKLIFLSIHTSAIYILKSKVIWPDKAPIPWHNIKQTVDKAIFFFVLFFVWEIYKTKCGCGNVLFFRSSFVWITTPGQNYIVNVINGWVVYILWTEKTDCYLCMGKYWANTIQS